MLSEAARAKLAPTAAPASPSPMAPVDPIEIDRSPEASSPAPAAPASPEPPPSPVAPLAPPASPSRARRATRPEPAAGEPGEPPPPAAAASAQPTREELLEQIRAAEEAEAEAAARVARAKESFAAVTWGDVEAANLSFAQKQVLAAEKRRQLEQLVLEERAAEARRQNDRFDDLMGALTDAALAEAFAPLADRLAPLFDVLAEAARDFDAIDAKVTQIESEAVSLGKQIGRLPSMFESMLQSAMRHGVGPNHLARLLGAHCRSRGINPGVARMLTVLG